MATTLRATPRRPRKVRRTAGISAGLERDGVVAAALALLQDHGLDALSTRRLAERLGVQSPALYWHVRDKRELLGLIADAICADMRLPAPDRPFRERLESIAWEYRRVLMAYRDAPRLFAEQPPTGPHRMALYDAALGAFRDSGLELPQAVAMTTFYRHFLLGMVAEEARVARVAETAPMPARALGVELAHLGEDARRYPHLREAAGLFEHLDSEALFRLGLGVLLDGVRRPRQGRG